MHSPTKCRLRKVTSKYSLAQIQVATCCKKMMRRRVHRSSGCGRTSLDSMTYSSESSPTAHSHAGRSRTGEGVGFNNQIDRNVLSSMLAWMNDESDDSAGHAPEEGTSTQNKKISSQCVVRIATGDALTRQKHVLESETAALVSSNSISSHRGNEAIAVNEQDNGSSVVELHRVCSRGCSASEVGVRAHREGIRPQRENARKAANLLPQDQGLCNAAMPSSGIEGNTTGAFELGDYQGVLTIEETTTPISSVMSLSQGLTAVPTPVDQRKTVEPFHAIGPKDEEARREDHGSMKESSFNKTEAEMRLWLSQDSEEEESVCDGREQAGLQLRSEASIK